MQILRSFVCVERLKIVRPYSKNWSDVNCWNASHIASHIEAANPLEIWHFQFSNGNFPTITPLGLHFESTSHPWGELIGTHNSLYCSTEREIITWWQINGTHKLCAFPQGLKTYSSWIFRVAGNLTHMLYSRKYLWIITVSHNVYSNAKCAMPSWTWHAIIKKG